MDQHEVEIAKTQRGMKMLVEKWKPLLQDDKFDPIVGLNGRPDAYRAGVTATIIENTIDAVRHEQATMRELFGSQFGFRPDQLISEVAPTNSTGSSIDNYDPVLISMVRRSMPNLIAYDVCGVQPMTGPTGLVFAFRPRYTSQTGADAFYNEANTNHSVGASTSGNTEVIGQANLNLGTTPTGNAQTYNFSGGMSTTQAEALGSSGNVQFSEMSFSIEKVDVTAKSRALKGEYSIELAQDLKAIHNMDAETEISQILSTEILAEINREVIRTIYVTAKTGCATDTNTAGTFDLDIDSNGRWLVEKFKGFMFQLEKEANQLAKETRRGRGNIIITSSNVASALDMAGLLDVSPMLAQTNQLTVDDTGNTFVGVVNRKYKVFIDPYATVDFAVMGYKGPSPFDAGLFYCPYVPLQLMRAPDPSTFQPKLAYKTRYGMVANPFAEGTTAGLGRLQQNSNLYYRRFLVSNLM